MSQDTYDASSSEVLLRVIHHKFANLSNPEFDAKITRIIEMNKQLDEDEASHMAAANAILAESDYFKNSTQTKSSEPKLEQEVVLEGEKQELSETDGRKSGSNFKRKRSEEEEEEEEQDYNEEEEEEEEEEEAVDNATDQIEDVISSNQATHSSESITWSSSNKESDTFQKKEEE